MQGDWRLAWRDVPRATVRFVHADAARRFLARWASQASVLTALRGLLAQRQLPEAQAVDAVVLDVCARLLRDGRLHCWAVEPIRGSDLPRRASGPEAPAPTRQPETVRELREIVSAVEGGFVVRALDSAVAVRWDRRAMEPAVETDWDQRAVACEVSVDWDLLGLETQVEAIWEDAGGAEAQTEEGGLG